MRTNVAPSPIHTHEGARAVRIDPVSQLRRSVCACLLFEDNFYEDGVSIAERIHAEVAEVLKLRQGPQLVGDLAFEARSKFKLRHVPLWLTVALVKARVPASQYNVASAVRRVIQRPDELAELLAMYWKNGKEPISAPLKKGLASAFEEFDEYALRKYCNRSGAIAMRDVLFLCHPKPKTELQAGLWKQLADKELTAPDTWESELSAGKEKRATFERLIAEHKLGALALLRNLRGMQEAGVPDTVLREAILAMKTERVLPFRFITAAKYAPNLEPELEHTMFRSVAELPKLPGKTVLVVDNSGSMYGDTVSHKSELLRSDAACALAMLLREVCQEAEIVVFSDQPVRVPPRRGFGLRDAIQNATSHNSTNTQLALELAAKLKYDRCIVVTDEQSHQAISQPLQGKDGYVINVANNRNGIGYGAWTHIDGWSEAVVTFVSEAERESPAIG